MKWLTHRDLVVVIAGVVLTALAVAGVWGQSDSTTGATAGDSAANGASQVGTDPVSTAPVSDKIELHVKETDLSSVLKLLADQHKLNIVAGKDVTGKVTADLYGVSVDQALKAVLEMNGYAHRREDNFVYVYTKQQLADYEVSQM
jgi:type II secretory pathway component HofQ